MTLWLCTCLSLLRLGLIPAPGSYLTRNTCTKQTLAHPSKISLENPSNIDNFPTCQKNRPYYNWKTERNNNNNNKKLSFIKTKRLGRITLNGLMNGKKSVLTILLLNNGCSHQDPVLVAFLRYFESFSSQIFTHVALKKDFLLDGQVFSLKIGASSKVTCRLPALRTALHCKMFIHIFCLKKTGKFYIISKLVTNVY